MRKKVTREKTQNTIIQLFSGDYKFIIKLFENIIISFCSKWKQKGVSE